MARIALNARLLIPGRLEGIGWFTHECYQRLISAHPEHEFQLFFDRAPSTEFCYGKNASEVRLLPPARRPFLYDAWFDYAVTGQLKRWKADVFLSTDGMLSRRTQVPQIPVFHDLNFMHHPEWMPAREARYYRSRFPEFAKIAAKILTVSDHSRQDIATQFQVPIDQIQVVHNAPSHEYRVLDSEAIRQDQRNEFTGGQPFFLFVGSLHPRKNISGLLDSYRAYRLLGGQAELLIVGASMWTDEMQSERGVHFCGRLDRAKLAQVVGASQGLVFIPWFEGFGVPIVEAFACGVPVIASDRTSMPEVCGGAAAALVEPDDAKGIASWMRKLDVDDDFRSESIRRGLKRAQDFSWERSAERMWQSVSHVLKP
ncbi:glycosyltransferase family 4 protein [Flavobacteriales bacterium]|nr:glycosyltransferase family 4 protein [Flavobacteriales bacterium]